MLRLLIARYHKDTILEIEHKILQELNPYESKRLNDYNFENREHRIVGFHLLKDQLNHFKESFSLFDLHRNPFHKPYFKNTYFDFSISHSGSYVACLASLSQKVGLDLEFENQESRNIENNFFCRSEQECLKQQKGIDFYYYLHTRKEAFSKAVGLGIFLEHKLVDVQNTYLFFNNEEWHLNSLNILNGYSLSYATNNKNTFCEIMEIEI